jgi:hypothetical protein
VALTVQPEVLRGLASRPGFGGRGLLARFVYSLPASLVGHRLATNQRAARRSTTHPYLLRGLVSCGVCRLSCSGVTRTATDTRYRYYRCLGKQAQVSSGRASPCPARFIPATQLDELVWADLCVVLQHPELVTQAMERAHSGAWVPQELRRRQATLRSVRASVARQRQRLLEAYLAEVIDLNTFQRQDQGLASQEADLLAREREVAAQGEQLVQVSAIAQSMTAVLEQLRVGLGQASFEQRRQVMELLIDRVVVTDGHVEIRYVIPTTPGSTQTRFCHLRTDYFDLVALAVADRVKAWWTARSAALVDPGRDGVADAAAAQQPAASGVAVTPVGQQMPRQFARAATPTRPWHPDGIQQRLQLGALMALPRREGDRQRPPFAVHGQVQLGGQPAPAVPQRLILRVRAPPFGSARAGLRRAPAAC